VADLGTKALAKQRVMLLLHEIGVHAEFGQRQVGQEEFDHQWSKHGEVRQLSKLAKAVARIILVMGLEPTAGAEISGSDGEQCSMDASPNNASEDDFWIFFWMLVLGLLWLGLLIAVVKFMQWTREEFRQHAWQLADGDRAYGEQQSSINRTMEQVSALEGWVTGLEGQITMVSDYSESVHHGLVELGGFTRVTDLTAEERRGLYATERANLVARNAMGSNYYLRGIRQQFHGSATGDNTDNPENDESMHGESAEEEAPVNDPYVSGGSASSTSRPIGVSVIMNDLTTQLNNALAREHWRDASVLQHLMMDLLDLTYQNGYDNAERRNRYMEHLIQRFEEMTADARRNGHVDVVAVYENLLQQWRRVPR